MDTLNGLAAWLRCQANNHAASICANDPVVKAEIATLCAWANTVDALASPAKVDEDEPLSLEALQLFAAKLVKSGKLNWAGFRKDEDGRYTIPVISPAIYKLVCAALSADGGEDKRDAERYQLLRFVAVSDDWDSVITKAMIGVLGNGKPKDDAHFDAAVDAARAAKAKGDE